VRALGSVLCDGLRNEQIVFILFLKQQLNFDTLNIAVICKGKSEINFNSILNVKNILPFILKKYISSMFGSVARYMPYIAYYYTVGLNIKII
jgi:hypothetical protein